MQKPVSLRTHIDLVSYFGQAANFFLRFVEFVDARLPFGQRRILVCQLFARFVFVRIPHVLEFVKLLEDVSQFGFEVEEDAMEEAHGLGNVFVIHRRLFQILFEHTYMKKERMVVGQWTGWLVCF